jgi:hypothetical protein
MPSALKRTHHLTMALRATRKSVALPVIASLLFITLVGNYGAAINPAQRFPGAFELDSSDGRDTPIEAVRLAEKFFAAEGPAEKVVSDASTERIFETYAFTQGLGAFPQWQFFMSNYTSSQLHQLARSGGIDAIVIDNRITEGGGQAVQFPGFPPYSHPPVTAAVLARLMSFSWLRVIYRTDHYTVLAVRRPR